MVQKTNTAKKESNIETVAMEAVQVSHMSQDLKTAVLIVSVVANLFIFTAWLALQVTTQYDNQIASFLFNR
jgi:hypothetical protein